MIQDIGTIAVIVSDIQKSERWYVEKLGFKARDDRGPLGRSMPT
ncbi:MAG: VOC family protein [Candidatus Bathyarchaeia archaeon]